jgi:hypothetical protein
LYLDCFPAALDRYLAAEPAMSPFPTAPFCRRILGIVLLLLAVEAANDAFPNYRCFSRIVGFSQARSETRQFFTGEFSFRVELIGKSNDAQLIFRIEALDLFDDLISSHDVMLPQTAPTFNLASQLRKSRSIYELA